MEYRAGKCSKCGAEYKIPASFAHDVARCKECGGVVNIGKLGAPAPGGSPPEAKPVPARRVAPSGEKKPPLEEHVPSGKKGSGPSMLERLKAEREEDASADKPAARTPAPKKPAATKAETRRTPVKAGAQRGAAAAATPRSGSSTRSTRSSSRRRGRGDKDGKDGEDGKDSGGRSGRRQYEKPEKKLPLGGLIGLALLVVVVVVFWIFKDQIMGTADDGGTEVSAANPTEETTDGTDTDGNAEELPDETPDPDEAAPDEDPDETPEEKPKPEKPKGDPDSVDLLALPDYGAAFNTTPEDWAMMNESIVEWMDPWAGAAGGRAGKRILALKVQAMPVILNHFKILDLSTEEGHQMGSTLNRSIQDLCNGTNFGWKHPDQEPDDYLYFNKQVVVSWSKQWDKVLEQGIEYWIKMGKHEERDAKEAKRLRKLYGDGAATADATPPAAGDMSDDDLEVD